MIRRISVPLLAGSFLCLSALVASAQTVTFIVPMNGSQEVPTVVGPSGTGVATLTLDVATRLVSVSGGYSGMSSNQTLVHLHGPAARGASSGNILITLAGTGGTLGMFAGSATLSTANVANLLNNLTYVNVHTIDNPGGEIRGQVEFPASTVLCNGSFTNPIALLDSSATAPPPTSPSNAPVIGKNLRLDLDCRTGGLAGKIAIFRVGFGTKPASPIPSRWGEILVPITAGTGRSFLATVPGSRIATLGPILLPSGGQFLGLSYTVQGVCPASPSGYLSNALVETIGTL